MSKKCFVIGPFGEVGSEQRQWFNFLLDSVLRPALEPEYDVNSALDSAKPGDAVDRIRTDLREATVVVADLTYSKPDVLYELGLRHAFGGACVLVRRIGEAGQFALLNQETIAVRATFVQEMGGYAVVDLRQLHTSLRQQVDAAVAAGGTGGPPADGHQARFFEWSVIYSNTIAADWLGKQSPEIQDAIGHYENGGGIERNQDRRHVRLFAEYLALKSASGQKYDGKVFYVLDTLSHDTVFGYGVFKFPGTTVLIEALGTEEDDAIKITFRQPARQVTVFNSLVELNPYQYTVDFKRLRGQKLSGQILHPDTATLVGDTELVTYAGMRNGLVRHA
jgi:hypothetical protein